MLLTIIAYIYSIFSNNKPGLIIILNQLAQRNHNHLNILLIFFISQSLILCITFLNLVMHITLYFYWILFTLIIFLVFFPKWTGQLGLCLLWRLCVVLMLFWLIYTFASSSSVCCHPKPSLLFLHRVTLKVQ